MHFPGGHHRRIVKAARGTCPDAKQGVPPAGRGAASRGDYLNESIVRKGF